MSIETPRGTYEMASGGPSSETPDFPQEGDENVARVAAELAAAQGAGETVKATDDALAQWAQRLIEETAERIKTETVQVVGAAQEAITQRLDQTFEGLHDPYAVWVRGALFGAASVIVALFILVAVGLLFLNAATSLLAR